MKILIACEESQEVCKAFRALGFEAYSCDLQQCSGGHPEWHIVGDAVKEAYSGKYSMMIAHPPCTYMSRAGARWMYPSAGNLDKDRFNKAIEAKNLFLKLLNAPIKFIAIENRNIMLQAASMYITSDGSNWTTEQMLKIMLDVSETSLRMLSKDLFTQLAKKD